jgi:hypothetical protein
VALQLNALITISEADLYEDGDPTVRYHFRGLAAEQAEAVRLAGQETNGDTRLYRFLDACLESWEGVELSGKPAPCDEQTKRLLDAALADLLCTAYFKKRADPEAAPRESFRATRTVDGVLEGQRSAPEPVLPVRES